MPEKEYPVWCAEPNCGIDDCIGKCPFSPFVQCKRIEELEKKLSTYREEIYDNYKIEFDDIDKKIEALENIVLKRHKLGVKGEFYFSNKQIVIEKNEKELSELKDIIKANSLIMKLNKNFVFNQKEVLREGFDTIRQMIQCFMGITKLSKTVKFEVFVEWCNTFINLLKKLEGEKLSKIHWFLEECDNYFDDQKKCAQGYKPFQCNIDCHYYMPKPEHVLQEKEPTEDYVDDYYDPNKEECEHNRPFWECEICGNTRFKKEDADEHKM